MPRMFHGRSRYGRHRALSAAALLLTSLFLASSARAGRITLMYEMEPRANGAVDGVTQEQIRDVVIEKVKDMGWEAHPRTAGVVEADFSLSRGKHRATVAIVFDEESFVVRYVSSFNLGYSDNYCPPTRPGERGNGPERARDRLLISRSVRCSARSIHPTYNNYVREIEEDIALAIPRLRSAPAAASTPSAAATSIDEETRKLEALQATGILTEDEVEVHKRLLVAAPADTDEEPPR